MHAIQASHLHDLAAGAYAAVFAAQNEDDINQRYGLLAAAECLTAELKRITWELVESADIPGNDQPEDDNE